MVNMVKVYHVEIDYVGVLDGVEFWIAAYSLSEAWKDVCSMGIEADRITIRETDAEAIVDLVKTINEG